MPNVYAVNKTESSLSVYSWFVYYINNSNAEIVEVEGTVGEPLPSIGDTLTFGNYPQATNTPEPIVWTVLDVDSTNGKSLLIAKKVLDGKTYGTYSDSTRWSNCSLREWLNSTFKTTAFDSSEKERIILSHIQNPNNSSTATPGGVDTDDYLFCLSIGEANNTSYFSGNDDRKGYATQHAIDAGVSVYYGRASWWLRSPGNYNVRAAYTSDSGSVATSGDYVYNTYGVRPAMWVSFSGVTTVKYNAFKFSLNGTPYWYVIDGVHDTWTDDLSVWGYSEVPSVVLPTVTTDEWTLPDTASGKTTIQGGSTANAGKAGAYPREKIVFDNSCVYATMFWKHANNTFAGRVEIAPVNNSGYIGLYNTTNQALEVYWVNYATCSDSTATVVTVYDSSNVAYNAFKYTANNTDYYYVLDGTQTDWTDDLTSIGYHLISVAYIGAGNTNVQWNAWSWLYLNPNGSQPVPFDASMSYTFDSAYLGDGTRVNLTSHTITIGRPSASYTILGLLDTYSGFTAYKILYHAVK